MSTIDQRKPRVVLVCQVFYPDAQSTSQLFTELLTRLAADGRFRFMVICGYPSAIRTGSAAVPRHEVWNGIDIQRVGMRVDVKKSMLSRLLSYATFLAHTGWKLLTLRRSDIIFGVTNPPFLAAVLWITSLFRGFRYQYNLQDLHPEGLYLLGNVKQNALPTRLWMWFNRRSYRKAEKLFVLGRDMAPVLKKNYNIGPEKLVYIPHWSAVAPTLPQRFEDNPFAKTLGIEGKFVVQYSGNMGLWHDMETLVRAAAQLKDDPTIRFLFIGAGRRRAGAETLARELGADNILWRDFVPKEQLEESLACCHAALVSQRAGLEGIAVPCKIYGIMAAGRPMIAQVPAGSEAAMVVDEERCGVVVEPGSAEGIVAAIRKLAADKQEAWEMGLRAYRAYQQKYTVDRAVERFVAAWTTTVRERSGRHVSPLRTTHSPLTGP